jgi:hypothetical protein
MRYTQKQLYLNPVNAELYPICHLLGLLGAHPILHISRIRVNDRLEVLNKMYPERNKSMIILNSSQIARIASQFNKPQILAIGTAAFKFTFKRHLTKAPVF